jgi:hypothetical protein
MGSTQVLTAEEQACALHARSSPRHLVLPPPPPPWKSRNPQVGGFFVSSSNQLCAPLQDRRFCVFANGTSATEGFIKDASTKRPSEKCEKPWQRCSSDRPFWKLQLYDIEQLLAG